MNEIEASDPEDLLPPNPDQEDEPTPAQDEIEDPPEPESPDMLKRVDGTTREIRDYLMDRDPEQDGEDELLVTVREALGLLLEMAATRKAQSQQLTEMEKQLQFIRDSV